MGRSVQSFLLLASFLALVSVAGASTWQHFGGDPGAQRYSSLNQINKSNVGKLRKAWAIRTGEQEEFGKRYNFSLTVNTPALIGDSIIACSAFNRIIALDPATGSEKWRYDPWENSPLYDVVYYRCRGLAYWELDEKHPGLPKNACEQRLFMALPSNHVVAVNARDGTLCRDFGDDGRVFVDRVSEMAIPAEIMLTNPGAVVGDAVVFGSLVADSYRASGPSGKVVALDVITGAVKWEYDPIPRSPEDEHYATWFQDSAKSGGGANVWTTMSVDEDRDLIFLPTGSPSPDMFGGLRQGTNEDANSVVALRGSTGEKVWSYQIVHHDLWDYDLPAAPVLLDLQRNGEKVPAVVQTTKQGLIFVFNAITGEPLFNIEERPVPQTTLTGEWTSPTQPFPEKPRPLLSDKVSEEVAWGFTFWDRRKCKKWFQRLDNEGIYTPPSERGIALRPSWSGGMNWGGPAVDPYLGIMVVNLTNVVTEVLLERRKENMEPLPGISVDDTRTLRRQLGYPMLDTPFRVRAQAILSPFGAPCNPPPWGKLAAVDLNTGDILWDRALGTIDRISPIFPFPVELGTPNLGGPLVTESGLIFIAATMDDRIRAFDIDDGEMLWSARLPAGGQAGPMTYEWEGTQYILIAAGGHAWLGTKQGDYYVAYALDE